MKFQIFMSFCDLENKVKVTNILSALKLVLVIQLCKFEENPSIGSKLSYIQDYGLENGAKVIKPVTMMYPLKSEKYPFICSRNISILAIQSTFVSWLLT